MSQSEATRRADQRTRKWLASMDPERREGFLKSLKGTREGMDPDSLFSSTVDGGFEWMEYVACVACKEWMSKNSSTRGDWAVDHRNCSSFQFFTDLDEIPEDYTTPLSDTELLASVMQDWEDEE